MKRAIAGLILMLLMALLLVHAVQRQLSDLWPALGVHPQVSGALRDAMDDQKRLSRLDPENEPLYRARFAAYQALHNRLEILRLGQEEIARTQERILFAAVAVALLLIGATYLIRRRREEERLERLETHLARLSAGESNLRLRERGSDTIAKVAGMIERTSDVMGAQRQRLRYLENLSSWQEAARRHAHEIRTPLTAAQLELDRMAREVESRDPELRNIVDQRRETIRAELDRLGAFTRSFTSFASIARPAPAEVDLSAFLDEFVETYRDAWPLELQLDRHGSCPSRIDRSLTRQVLVNLCANSALAGSRRIRFSVRCSPPGGEIDVADDGGGIPQSIRQRLFQPYATTRNVGEGMGLGLAISKKIMLDQGGDLELVTTSREGTTFRMSFGRGDAPCN